MTLEKTCKLPGCALSLSLWYGLVQRQNARHAPLTHVGCTQGMQENRRGVLALTVIDILHTLSTPAHRANSGRLGCYGNSWGFWGLYVSLSQQGRLLFWFNSPSLDFPLPLSPAFLSLSTPHVRCCSKLQDMHTGHAHRTNTLLQIRPQLCE